MRNHSVQPLPGCPPWTVRDRDRVAGDRQVVVRLRRGRGQVHAAVADVLEPLLADRPVGVVVVVAAPGEPHRLGDQEAVARARHPDGFSFSMVR